LLKGKTLLPLRGKQTIIRGFAFGLANNLPRDTYLGGGLETTKPLVHIGEYAKYAVGKLGFFFSTPKKYVEGQSQIEFLSKAMAKIKKPITRITKDTYLSIRNEPFWIRRTKVKKIPRTVDLSVELGLASTTQGETIARDVLLGMTRVVTTGRPKKQPVDIVDYVFGKGEQPKTIATMETKQVEQVEFLPTQAVGEVAKAAVKLSLKTKPAMPTIMALTATEAKATTSQRSKMLSLTKVAPSMREQTREQQKEMQKAMQREKQVQKEQQKEIQKAQQKSLSRTSTQLREQQKEVMKQQERQIERQMQRQEQRLKQIQKAQQRIIQKQVTKQPTITRPITFTKTTLIGKGGFVGAKPKITQAKG
jgi:HSP90 family molecular chaperone